MDQFREANDIGTGNQRGNVEIRVGVCQPHGEWPLHVDMVVPINGPCGGAHKIRVDKYGNIIDDDLV